MQHVAPVQFRPPHWPYNAEQVVAADSVDPLPSDSPEGTVQAAIPAMPAIPVNNIALMALFMEKTPPAKGSPPFPSVSQLSFR